jgi:hypothetical protein
MFYVYVYKDPRPTKNLQVVYVGKGTGERMYAHWKKRVHKNKGFGAFLALLRKLGLEPMIEVVAEFEEETAALTEESRLIALYGRRDLKTGALFNLTDGGEGFAGAVRTEEWRSNIRDAHLTPEANARMREASKARWADPEYREKVTTRSAAAIRDPEVHARREAAKAAVMQTPEFRQTMRNVAQKQWATEDYAEKVAAGQRAVQGTAEARAMKSENSKRLWSEKGEKVAAGIKAGRSTQESRAKTSAQSKAQWADPEKAAHMKAMNQRTANDPAVKAAKSAAAKALWADPEWRDKMKEARAAKKLAALQAA